MQETTQADRQKELRELLELISAHPDKAFTAERERVAVLQAKLAAEEKASA